MKFTTTALVVALLAGCATGPMNYEPIVDLRSGQEATYQQDLAACRGYATRVMNAQQSAAAGAIAGALLGAALGAAAGGNGRFNGRMAGVGAITGGVGAAAEAEGGQRGIVNRCMAGRGYAVLN